MGEESTGAVLTALAIKRKIYTTMKQQRKDDVKSICIDRIGLSVCTHIPRLQSVIIYYEDVEEEQTPLYEQSKIIYPKEQFIWISPKIPRDED